MNRSIEWIKKIVRLCMAEFELEEEKKECFTEMEQEYLQFTELEKKNIRDIMMTQFEVNDMIYVLSIIIQYIEVKDFQEDLMKSILKGDFDGCVGSIFEYQSLFYIKGEYERKRMLYKKNMLEYKNMLGVDYPYLTVQKRNKKRIVMITGQLLSILHAPTRIIMNMAYILQNHFGYEVLFFICPCNMKLMENVWYQQRIENSRGNFDDIPMRISYRDEIFQGYQIGMRQGSLKEYSMMLFLIHAWNPAFVLDMDTTNAIAGVIGTFTTLVSFPMASECPISEGEILVRIERKDDGTEQGYLEMLEKHQTQLFMKEKFPVIVEESNKHYIRAELKLPENKFLIAVVGNRLFIDIDQKFVQVMKKIIEKIPEAAFVVIGENDGITGYFEDEIFDEHLYYLGFCDDLLGVYQILDLYLNPKRMGGGFSGGMALLAEIPVVTLPDNDVAYNCGEQFVVQNYEEMIDTVCRYVNDQNFYEQKRQYAKRYREENRDEKLVRYVKELLEGITKIMSKQDI